MRRIAGIATGWALLMPQATWAAGYSLDIEMIHPGFLPGSLPGIDAAGEGEAGAFRVGGLVQFEKDPLVILLNGEDGGAVVSNRVAMDVGISYDVSDRVALNFVLPTAASFGGEFTDSLGGDGAGLGDAWAGARIFLADPGPVSLAAKAELGLPTGGRANYLGEGSLRFHAALLAGVDLGPVAILGDVGINARPLVETEEDLAAGAELDTRLGVRVGAVPELLGVYAGVAGKGAFNALYQGGGGNAAEALFGVQLTPGGRFVIDLGGGKGIADGYGSTDFRAMAGLTWIYAPPKPVEEPKPVVERPAPVEELTEIEILPEPVVEPPPKVEWKEGELARVEQEAIIIRDQIQFEEGKDVILAPSLPVLREVARLMNENGQIGYMIIEGHASNEGSFEYNYDLSNLRARSVWQALIEAGVHPSRISYRGMGEVQPVVAGDAPEAREANRRVTFNIVQMYQPGDEIPALSTTIYLPWNGEQRTIPAPKLPAAYTDPKGAKPSGPPPEPPKNDVNQGVPGKGQFDEDEDEIEIPGGDKKNEGGGK